MDCLETRLLDLLCLFVHECVQTALVLVVVAACYSCWVAAHQLFDMVQFRRV